MSQVVTDALILRSNPANDHSRYLLLLSKERGLIECFARGAEKAKSPLRAVTESFSFCEMTLFHNKEKYYLDRAAFKHPFKELKSHVETLSCAAQLSDIAIDGLGKAVEFKKSIYEILIYAFYSMEKNAARDSLNDEIPKFVGNILNTTYAAEIRLLSELGYGLSFGSCGHCGRKMEDCGEIYFDFRDMAFICEEKARQLLPQNFAAGKDLVRDRAFFNYSGNPIMKISPSLYEALKHFSFSQLPSLFSFRGKGSFGEELSSFSEAYMSACLEKRYGRLAYLYRLSYPGNPAELQ